MTTDQKTPTGAPPTQSSSLTTKSIIVEEPPVPVDLRFGEMPPEFAALDDEVEFDGDKLPTLQQVGKVLPIGYPDQVGKVHREFSLCEWDWDVEEELGKLSEGNEEMMMMVYISEVIGRGVERLGDIDFTRLKRSQRRLITSQFYFADALYMYIWIRIGALGHELRLPEFKCPICRAQINYVGDLRSLEVKVVTPNGGAPPTKVVKLPRAITYAGGERTAVEVGALKWAFMETGDEGMMTNAAKFRRATLQHGVVSVEGAPAAPVQFSTAHLKQMGPKGVNMLVAAIDEVGGGVVMQIEGPCPKCKKDFTQEINWLYTDFFGRSSQ